MCRDIDFLHGRRRRRRNRRRKKRKKRKKEEEEGRRRKKKRSCSVVSDYYSVHGIFKARVLEWVAISFSRGSSQPRDRTRVSRIAGRRFTV